MQVRSVRPFRDSCFAVMFACVLSWLVSAAALAQGADAAKTKTDIATTGASMGAKTRPSLGSRARAQWRLGIRGENYATENRKEQAQTVGLGLDGRLQIKLLPSMDLGAEVGLGLESGQAQSRFGDHVPHSGVNLNEALVSVRPLESLTFSAGAVNQSHLRSPLLVSPRPFPGALERFEYGSDEFKATLKAQQTIPTSVTLATKVTGGEKTPLFLSEGVELGSKPIPGLDLVANGSLFRFQSLPATVAFESEIHGNTVEQTGPATSRFAYDFAGWTAGGAGYVDVTRTFRFGTGLQMLRNTSAPQGFRNGQVAFGEAVIRFPHDIRLRPRGEMFFSESDSSPAYYNSSDFGHNNRKGYAAELELAFPRERFRIGARFVDADLIEPSLHQSRQQYLMLKLETMYENF